jgi:hypothetical protein
LIPRRKLRSHVRSLGKKPSITQKNDLAERRQRLKIRIEKFCREAMKIIPLSDDDDLTLVRISDDDGDFLVAEDAVLNGEDDLEWEPEDDNEEIVPEAIQLLLPSTLTHMERTRLQIQEIAAQEVQLRVGQANDTLEAVRNSLAQVSLVFRTQVREARSVYTKTRSWKEIQRSNLQLGQHVSRYKAARNALIQLQASQDICDQFMEIKSEHLKMPGDIVEANRIGQRSDSLAWFWQLDANRSGTQEGWMKECRFQPFIFLLDNKYYL